MCDECVVCPGSSVPSPSLPSSSTFRPAFSDFGPPSMGFVQVCPHGFSLVILACRAEDAPTALMSLLLDYFNEVLQKQSHEGVFYQW